jgi:hypothetical protein
LCRTRARRRGMRRGAVGRVWRFHQRAALSPPIRKEASLCALVRDVSVAAKSASRSSQRGLSSHDDTHTTRGLRSLQSCINTLPLAHTSLPLRQPTPPPPSPIK